jgi:hypothetical protein
MGLFIDDSLLINKGTNRACYVHPEDKNKCIKINISKNKKETKREIWYYKYLEKRKVSYDMLARYYGMVKTNFGEGEVVELIRDYDGKVSKELDKYLDEELSLNQKKYIKELVSNLKTYLYNEKIYVKDLNSVNISFQRLDFNGNGRLVIIDGLSHGYYVHLICRISESYLLKKIKYAWERFFLGLSKKLI